MLAQHPSFNIMARHTARSLCGNNEPRPLPCLPAKFPSFSDGGPDAVLAIADALVELQARPSTKHGRGVHRRGAKCESRLICARRVVTARSCRQRFRCTGADYHCLVLTLHDLLNAQFLITKPSLTPSITSGVAAASGVLSHKPITTSGSFLSFGTIRHTGIAGSGQCVG